MYWNKHININLIIIWHCSQCYSKLINAFGPFWEFIPVVAIIIKSLMTENFITTLQRIIITVVNHNEYVLKYLESITK